MSCVDPAEQNIQWALTTEVVVFGEREAGLGPGSDVSRLFIKCSHSENLAKPWGASNWPWQPEPSLRLAFSRSSRGEKNNTDAQGKRGAAKNIDE